VLYQHLREATGRGSRWVSVLVSSLGTGFLFAALHPQGWLALPVLMSLAVVFALAREWHRSVVPCIVAHGINNGVATLLLFLTAG
jgi:membrane protease YdiL (CAAX protease family)